MSKVYFEDETFEKINSLGEGEYENCVFKHCDFSSLRLSEIVFIECEFYDCNLTTAQIAHTSFREVKFKDCKLMGLRFDSCNPFLLEFEFENCNINHSVFFKLKLKSTKFKNCTLHEVDFSETDLISAKFDICDLKQATFVNSNLEKADFRTAYNYSFDPESNRIKKARFSKEGLAGLLAKYDIVIE